MAIEVDCSTYGIIDGYSRIGKIRFDYSKDGIFIVSFSVEYYISRYARENLCDQIFDVYFSVPITAFCGSFSEGGRYSDPDPRKTIYNLLSDKNRNLFEKEIELGIDFRTGESI